jgi:hypothetical protein
MLDGTSASVMVVSQAKRKWGNIRKNLPLKMGNLMKELDRTQKQAVLHATMEDGRQNCLVATITDDMFDAVFASEPDLKPGSDPAKKKFVEPKVKFQKRRMKELLLSPENHIVDNVFKQFYDEYTKATNDLLQRHFQQLQKDLGEYSATLRAQAPIDYRVDSVGMAIREELEQELVTTVRDSETLKELVPQVETRSEGSATTLTMVDMDDCIGDLAAIFSRLSKKRKKDAEDPAKVKVKKESV